MCQFNIISLAGNKNLNTILPDSIQSWNHDEDIIYNSENLYNYIDGGAELYISYGFENAIARVYTKTGEPKIRVEIFDMIQPKNAYGIYSISTDKDDKLFGQGSQYLEGSVIFWKNRYFVSILADYETPQAKTAIFNIADSIDSLISGKGQLPEIITNLKNNETGIEGIIYFNHSAWQNTYYYLSDDNIFNLTNECDAVLARIPKEQRNLILILIKYPSAEISKKNYLNFLSAFDFTKTENQVYQVEDGKWMTAKNDFDMIYCIFNGNSVEEVNTAMDQVYKLFHK